MMSDEHTSVDVPLLVSGLLLAWCTGAGCERESRAPEATPEPATAPEQGRTGSATGTSERPSDERFRSVVRPEILQTGDDSEVTFEIRPADGLKINREYPVWSLQLDDSNPIEMEKRSFDRNDFDLDEGKAAATTTLTIPESGEKTLSGTANFSVCNDERCHVLRDEPVRFRVKAARKGGTAESSNGDE